MKASEIGCLGIVVVVGLIAFGNFGGGVSDQPPTKQGQVATSREVANAFRSNEISAKARFEGAPILISGRLYEIQSGRDSPIYIFRDGAIAAKGVASDMAPAASLRAGQSISLDCESLMYVLGYVTPQGCRLTNAKVK